MKTLQKEVEEIRQIVGFALKELRLHSNMSYYSLSKETGIHPHTIKDIEECRNKKGASMESLFTLMAYFNYYHIK
jgi:DNA-binding XRE family transcriptional regulator